MVAFSKFSFLALLLLLLSPLPLHAASLAQLKGCQDGAELPKLAELDKELNELLTTKKTEITEAVNQADIASQVCNNGTVGVRNGILQGHLRNAETKLILYEQAVNRAVLKAENLQQYTLPLQFQSCGQNLGNTREPFTRVIAVLKDRIKARQQLCSTGRMSI